MINTVDYIFVEVAVCTFSCTIRPVDVHSDLAQKLGNEFWTFNGQLLYRVLLNWFPEVDSRSCQDSWGKKYTVSPRFFIDTIF